MKHLFTFLFAFVTLTMTTFGQMNPGTAGSDQNIAYNTAPHLLTATPPTGGTSPYSYKWQSSLDNNTFANIDGATDLNYQPGALTVSTWYRQVQFSATPGESVTTNVVAIHVYGMGVEEGGSFVHNVYPNPTSGAITLEFKEGITMKNGLVELFTAEGQRVSMTKSTNGDRKETYSLMGKPAGIYFLRVTIDGRSETIRVVKK